MIHTDTHDSVVLARAVPTGVMFHCIVRVADIVIQNNVFLMGFERTVVNIGLYRTGHEAIQLRIVLFVQYSLVLRWFTTQPFICRLFSM